MRIIACPGQGSQSVGFLSPWLESVPGFAAEIEKLSEASGRDLVTLGTTADEETIKDTANAQPLIVGAAIAAFRSSMSHLEIGAVVGHSVGEFAAAAIADVVSDEDAMRLVSIRADAMAEAAAAVQTCMAAVLGGDPDTVAAELERRGLFAANFNGAGQIVAAGAKSAVQELIANPLSGTRCIELKVAGAFHTSYMDSAVAKLREAAGEVRTANPRVALYSNHQGQRVEDGRQFLDLMVNQVANPVRWDLCMQSLDGEGVDFIELPPAGALAGLAKRGMPLTTAYAIKTPSDLEKLDIK